MWLIGVLLFLVRRNVVGDMMIGLVCARCRLPVLTPTLGRVHRFQMAVRSTLTDCFESLMDTQANPEAGRPHRGKLNRALHLPAARPQYVTVTNILVAQLLLVWRTEAPDAHINHLTNGRWVRPCSDPGRPAPVIVDRLPHPLSPRPNVNTSL
jgi:hypothetical protein